MTLRRLWVLVHGLPRESHCVRYRLGEYADWDATFHRLTDIADQLVWANWQRTADEKTPSPTLFRRPGG